LVGLILVSVAWLKSLSGGVMIAEYRAMLEKARKRIDDYLDAKVNEGRLEALLREIEALLKK
jgi:hypothetical protein